MKLLWKRTSNVIGLLVVALEVILADNRSSTDISDMKLGRSHTGQAR